jgi:hypothetical protein
VERACGPELAGGRIVARHRYLASPVGPYGLADRRWLWCGQDAGGPEAREDHEEVHRCDPEPDGSGAHGGGS